MKNQYRRSKKSYKLRFYVLSGLIAILLVAGSFLIHLQLQSSHLSLSQEDIDYVSFEPMKEIKKWHNQDIKFVYLTFDDGPSHNAEKVLDILKENHVPATFFVLGTSINNNTDSQAILNRMLDEGHYIGMHTMTHQYDYLYKGATAPQNFVNELKEEQQLIASLTNGFESQLCRAPYGTGGGTFKDGHVQALKDNGLKCWDWDVDSLDWKYSNPDQVMDNVKYYTEMNSKKENLVVLFHEKNSTIEVLPRVIEYYRDLGYEFLAYNPNHHFSKNFFHNDDI